MTTTQPIDTDTGGPEAPVRTESDGAMTTGQWVRLGILAALLVLLTATNGLWGLVVVIGIVAMVFFHELGHFIAAKRAGMMVTEFFIGFGPRIWSFRRGETEYGLKVIPAGAYVKIIGMHNLEEVDAADEGRSYRQGRFRDRFAVVTAGVGMNFLLALMLIWGVLAVTGTSGGSLTEKPDESKWVIGQVYPGSGAAAAGIVAGDKIVAVDGTPVDEFNDLGPLVKADLGTVDVSVRTAERTRVVPVELREFTAEDGSIACCLGIQNDLPDAAVRRVNPVTAVPQSFKELGVIGVESVKALGRFFSPDGLRDFGGQVANAGDDREAAREPASSGSGASGGRVARDEQTGENRLISLIGVFRIGTQAAESGVTGLLVLFALLNTFLGIMNLLPLLPFDGGHAVIAVYERVQEWRRHQRARYFADVSRLLPLTYVVVLVLAGIFVTTTYLDLANPLQLPE
ncbi:MAG: site-2 protease family protein [Acidimicrobiales bacterium]